MAEHAKHRACTMARALQRLLDGRSDSGAAPTEVVFRAGAR